MIKNKKLLSSFVFMSRGHKVILIRRSYKERLLGQGIEDPSRFFSEGAGIEFFNGRDLIPSVLIEGSDNERMAIRHYRRGGFARKISKDIFCGIKRPFKELMVSEEAKIRGIPTAEVLAVIKHKIFGIFYRAVLITKVIPGGVDVVAYLDELAHKPTKKKLRGKRKIIELIAELVRKMHCNGIYHADLHPKNIVIQRNNPGNNKVYIIDFDKSTIKEKLNTKQKMKNLYRFHRSLDRLIKKGMPITRTDQLRFFKSYFKKDGNLKLVIRKYLQGYTRHRKFRSLGKNLFTCFHGINGALAYHYLSSLFESPCPLW